jgi:monoamine oxidase
MIDVIIIGAGAAGLSAARILSQAGKLVHVLEARDRIGGRIYTINGQGFSGPVEGGAEFMHGDLPMTKALMKEAKVTYRAGQGQTWNVVEGHVSTGDFFDEGWSELIDRLQQLDRDMTIADFLQKHFSEPKYASLVESVKAFVQGYDAADVNKASGKALAEEWKNEDIKGYRPVGGYTQLMEFLEKEIRRHRGVFEFSSTVKKISRSGQPHVEVTTETSRMLTARKILVTVPISILKTDMIQFDPPLTQHRSALQQLEMGDVIKFLFEFKRQFWEQKNSIEHRHLPGLNFLFSDAFVPTWWTQKPDNIPLLTGWLAGPVVKKIDGDDSTLMNEAITSLSYLFGCTPEFVVNEIRSAQVINWSADKFSRGAYAYNTLQTTSALKTFTTPVDNMIYFAGEALYDGAEMGTVEAALISGRDAARKIMDHFN